MAINPFPSYPAIHQSTLHSLSPPLHYLLFPTPWPNSSPISAHKPKLPSLLLPIVSKACSKLNCHARSSTDENRATESEIVAGEDNDTNEHENWTAVAPQRTATFTSDYLSLGIREPVYEVVEVKSNGVVATRKINRRQLLRSSGLRPRDIRSVDPSLFLTNSSPSLLVREYAILLNLGSLRAIAMEDCVLIFDYNRKGGKAFIDSLLPRLNPKDLNGGHSMPFMLEVVEAALVSRIQRYEQRLMDLEPRVSMEHRSSSARRLA